MVSTPSTLSATPATQSDGGCLQVLCLPTQSDGGYRQVPRLPRKTPRRHGATPKTKRATKASPMPCVPRLPRKVQLHVSKCCACHAKCSYMSPSAVPATQSAATCRQAPRLPRKTPRRHGATPKTKRATRASPNAISAFPRKVTVDVTKCRMRGFFSHRTWCSGTEASARWRRYLAENNTKQRPVIGVKTRRHYHEDCQFWNHRRITDMVSTAQHLKCHACHAKWRWMSPSAVPATQSDGGYRQCHACHAKRRGATAPHLKPSTPPKPAQCHKCHACHAKCSYMSPSAVPATQSAATCLQVLCLPLKVQLHVAKCHACHGKRRGATAPHLKPSAHQSQPSAISAMPPTQSAATVSPSAVPATQSATTCRQVPRLPRKTPTEPHLKPKRATRASPMPCVPRLPRKVTVISPSATPATQSDGGYRQVHACHGKRPWRHGATPKNQARHSPVP